MPMPMLMPMRTHRHLRALLPLVLGLTFALTVAFVIADPIPPKQLRMATGSKGGAFQVFGARYAETLDKDGIHLTLQPSEGSAENITLLAQGKVDAAFAQEGSIDTALNPSLKHITSLGQVFQQPLWVFYRQDKALRTQGHRQLDRMADLQDWRLNIGTQGSGVHHLMRRLLTLSGMDPQSARISSFNQEDAALKLQAGEIDAMAFASNSKAPLVQKLLHTPGVGLLDFAHAEAYARLLPQVVSITLPAGLIDPARHEPPRSMHLIAATTSLLVRDNLHPALQALLVRTAQKIHAEPDWFQDRGTFPQPGISAFALDDDAAYVYRHGPSRWEHWLPFWAATFMDRMGLVMISLALVVLPLVRFGPKMYILGVRWRIYRGYRLLKSLDETLHIHPTVDQAKLASLLQQVNRLEAGLADIAMPAWNSAALYSLRSHIGLVQRSIQARMQHQKSRQAQESQGSVGDNPPP